MPSHVLENPIIGILQEKPHQLKDQNKHILIVDLAVKLEQQIRLDECPPGSDKVHLVKFDEEVN